MWKIILIAIILVAIAMAGMGIRMLFDRNAEFRGGSCRASEDDKESGGYACGCGAGYCASAEKA